jgi:hypothetical protein
MCLAACMVTVRLLENVLVLSQLGGSAGRHDRRTQEPPIRRFPRSEASADTRRDWPRVSSTSQPTSLSERRINSFDVASWAESAEGRSAAPCNQGALRLHVFDGSLSTPAIPNPSGKHDKANLRGTIPSLLGNGDHLMSVCIRHAVAVKE